MTPMTICLLIFLFMIILFMTNKANRIPMSAISIAVLVLLILTGCIDYKTALGYFGNTTVITMASMFIVAAGLSRTQMVTHISKLMYKVTKGSFTKVLAAYVLLTCLLGQFIPSIVALFAMVYPLVKSMCDEMKVSTSKMMFPIAIAAVSCAFIIEPIGPYAAWFVTDNGFLKSFGWTGAQFNNWTETAVLLPVGILTLLLAIFVIPRLLPTEPDMPISAVVGPKQAEQKPLSPVREVLGYGIFATVIVGLILGPLLGLPAWQVTLIGAIVVVASGVLTEREAISSMNLNVILLYIGVIVLGEALGKTGAAKLLGDSIASLLGHTHNGYIIGAAFYLVSFVMTSTIVNRAVTTTLIPIIIMTCASMGCDPRGPIILCSLASMSVLFSPMATAVVPMAMGAGGYSQKTMLKAGLVSGLFRGLAGVLIAMTLYPAF
jgi:solute carrier family 13 (sodium-dependent dicarboxylate transporter), member 2/3/5